MVVSSTVEVEAARNAHVARGNSRVREQFELSSLSAEGVGAEPAQGLEDEEQRTDLRSVIVVNEPAPAACVPRNALLYPASAPRPLPALRKGEQRRREHDEFDSYIAAWAPKTGAAATCQPAIRRRSCGPRERRS